MIQLTKAARLRAAFGVSCRGIEQNVRVLFIREKVPQSDVPNLL